MKFGWKVGLTFALCLVIIIGVGIQSYLGLDELRRANDWMIHTHVVIDTLDRTLSSLADVETGERGFVLTGEEHYLEPYQAALGQISKDLDALTTLTEDNSDQQQDLPRVRRLVGDKLELSREIIKRRRESGLEVALAEVRSGRGQRLMDDLRTVIGQMKDREQKLLETRSQAADRMTSYGLWMLAGGMFFSLLVLGIAAVIITRTARPGEALAALSRKERGWGFVAGRYAFAIAMVAVAALARWWLEQSFGSLQASFITFYPTVLFVAFTTGGGPGVLATVLSVAVVNYWFMAPHSQFGIEDSAQAISLGIFTGTCLALCALAERFQRAHGELRATSQYARSLLEASLDPLVTISPEGRITDVNQATVEATGVVRQKLIGSDFANYFVETEEARAGYHRVLDEGAVHDYPLTIRHASGRTMDVLYNATVYRNPKGEVEGVFAAARDVTERKAVERRQRATSDLLELFVKKSTRKDYLDGVVQVIHNWSGIRCVGIRIKDAQGRIPYESRVGFSLDFWQHENLLSLDQDNCLCSQAIRGEFEGHPSAMTTARGSFHCNNTERLLETMTPEERARQRGHCVKVGFTSLAVVPIRYRDEIIGAVHLADERHGLASEATIEFIEAMTPLIAEAIQRFNAEGALRGMFHYTRGLLEASLDPLVTISPTGQITDVNEATVQATGVPRETLVGSDFSTYFTAPEQARAGYRKVLAEGFVRDYPLTVRHISGRTSDVLYNAAVYRDEAGDVVGVFAAARDITERKRAEEELARYRLHLEELVQERAAALEDANLHLREVADELGRSNKDLEQFAYVASHDLQEPLRIVAGYLQLVERRYKDRLDADAHEFIDFAVDGASRMQTLINDLLAYSRIGSKGKQLAPTDLNRVFDQAVANLHQAIAESGATATHDPLPTINADATQMVQLFQNLIANAIKFRSDRPPEIHVAAAPDGDGRWQLSFRDNGIGLEPQYAERIFIIFQRLHTREQYPGTGIGLAICKRIVDRHGGRIWVESKVGHGSTFYVIL